MDRHTEAVANQAAGKIFQWPDGAFRYIRAASAGNGLHCWLRREVEIGGSL